MLVVQVAFMRCGVTYNVEVCTDVIGAVRRAPMMYCAGCAVDPS